MKLRTLLCAAALVYAVALPAVRGADSVIITEFMPSNNGFLRDEDGDSPDWIEIHNTAATPADLNGWYLTDLAENLTRWRFPATNLAANGYMTVFASGKNRRTPGAPLHTDFSLASANGYLALVKPDGTNIASAFGPSYPQQVGGVSYGIPVQQTTSTLVASGAVARVRVPADGSMAASWTGVGFNDASWTPMATGVGFETDVAGSFTPVTLANSVTDFSGTQGQNNWHYGFWNKGTDANGAYTNSEFIPFPNNHWTGSAWDWPAGDPPFTLLTAQGGQPSAGQFSHWAVRRYVNEFSGPVTLRLSMSQTSDWVYVTQTGTASSSVMYIYLLSAGEGYLDDMKLVAGSVPEAGANLIVNGDFEGGTLAPWTLGTNLTASTQTTTTTHGGSKAMRIVSSAAGASQSSSIWQSFSPTLTTGQPYTLSYWYLPGTNGSALIVRTSGSWLNSTPAYCGDGVVARVFVDGTQVYQQTVLASAVTAQFTTPARLGSQIDFVIDAGPLDNGLCDNVAFAATVETANPSLTAAADSAADWSVTGTQGEKNWFYGYYNKSTDPDQIYQAANFTPFPRGPGPQSATNFWDEEEWDWFSGDPPFDKIGQYWMMPNGANSGAEHWVIRRWVSTLTGPATVEWSAFKQQPDQNNYGGRGVRVRVMQNGTTRDIMNIRSNDVVGVRRTVALDNVNPGDQIEIALEPTDFDNISNDNNDRTFVTMTVRGLVSLTNQIQSNLEGAMRNVNATAYLRLPFNVANPALFNSLLLRVKYDDGLIAYLNGVEVARANAPLTPAWDSAAGSPRSDADALNYQEFNLNDALGSLQAGANVLAIHGLNGSAADGDFLILPELTATSVTNNPAAPRYFALPTPGSANGTGAATLGPLITSTGHTPNIPEDADALQITTGISTSFNPVSTVRLFYRVMYGGEVNVAMFDDGAHGDGAAGDGVWGATIPGSASTPGQLVRYYITATDTLNNSTRFPSYLDPKNSPQYLGTVVRNPAHINPLPVLQMFVQNTTLTTNAVGTRCSVFWDEEFYDNIEVNLHGQTTSFVFPKRSMDFNFNSGFKFRWKRDEKRVKAFDLISTYADRAYMRLPLSFETFRNAGVPTHFAQPVRMDMNGSFNSIMHMVEQANDDFLERNDLSPEGALYKMYFPLTNAYSGTAKQTRKNEPNDDLQALIAGLNQSGASLRNYLFDNIDVPELINFLATIQVVQNEDCCDYKNHYLYRDTTGTKEWKMLPWDLDLTFGRTFTGWVQGPGATNTTGGYFDTNIYAINRWYRQIRPTPATNAANFIGEDHPLAEALWSQPDTYQMFRRRWSTVQEEFLQVSNTHPLALKFERRVDELNALISPDSVADLAKWGTWWPSQNMAQAVSIIKTQYFAPRRHWIFNSLRAVNGGPYLGLQPTNAVILIGDIDINPASGIQAQEYIQLRNTNNYPVDISGWKLSGGISFTFRGGTVMSSNSVLYVSPDVTAFRARTSGPRGGQGLFVQGGYSGKLTARGESLALTDRTGRSVATTNTPPMPSLAQQYLRVVEIMYHPAPPPPGLSTNADEFEYIELKNIGPVTLDLAGVRFANGIDFTFGPGGITNLPSGQRVLVVRNSAAFLSRHPGVSNVAGQYAGQLDNAGENIRLEDATGEKILDFSYDSDWYPITDGFGFSLEVVNDLAIFDSWGLKTSWRPSGGTYGSPGAPNTPAGPIPVVFITEALTHTDPPLMDSVELINNSVEDADVSGWFLTDDFRAPNKYIIPDGTIIPAGDFLVLTEAHFNPTNPPSPTGFSLSSLGDEIYLFSTDGLENLTGYYQGWKFGAADNGVSFGHTITSDGREHFVAQTARTLGFDNPGPRVGPVVISEIHYHPPDLTAGNDNAEDEFIELHNPTAATVALFDAANPTNTWRLEGGVNFSIPTNITLISGGFLVIANFDPSDATKLASFRSRLGMSASVPVVGPFGGRLNNSGDTVRLLKPGGPNAGVVPYILVEQVDYKETLPWPAGADGTGATLQRSRTDRFGNDPVYWLAATPTPGAPAGSGAAPVITMQPATVAIPATSQAMLAVVASGPAPLRYQWQFNGGAIPGATNAQLVLANIQPSQGGNYQVTVFNQAGATQSSNATLSVYFAAYFAQQPQSTNSRPGFNVTFSALAISETPVTYQWRLNGTNIPGATSGTLTFTAQNTSGGTYQVVATDAVGSVVSAPATLSLVFEAFIAVHPVSQTVLAGQNVVLSVVVSNGATLPIGYRWRRGGVALYGTNYLNSYTSFFVITNAQPNFPTWNVVLYNAAVPSGKASTTATLTFLTDANGNGLADAWETTFFGPGAIVDPNEDSDGDTVNNRDEHTAGTDPTDPGSYLKIDSIAAGATLSFGAVSNRTYTILAADAPEGPWNPLIDVNARTNSRVETILDSEARTKRFYRVNTPRLPYP